MEKHSIEWNEILGDMIAEREVHEAIADEQEFTDEMVDDWYAALIIKDETYQDHKKERSMDA